MRGIALFVVIKGSVFPAMKMTAYDASVMMATQGNLAVSYFALGPGFNCKESVSRILYIHKDKQTISLSEKINKI